MCFPFIDKNIYHFAKYIHVFPWHKRVLMAGSEEHFSAIKVKL